MAKSDAPCYHCPLHRPGCHDPQTCTHWKKYQEQQNVRNKKRHAIISVNSMMDQYKKERCRFARNRRASNAK